MRIRYAITDYKGYLYDEDTKMSYKHPYEYGYNGDKTLFTEYPDYQAAEQAMIEAVKHLEFGIGQVQKLFLNN